MMGQLFRASAYDIDTKTCYVVDVDKFHANCYSYRGAVAAIHYLLRQKPYRVMWGGDYVAAFDDGLDKFEREEDLMGISTFFTDDDLLNHRDRSHLGQDYLDKVKFIGDQSKLWTKIDVWDRAIEYFDLDQTNSVKYDGYLINHTKQLAVDLKDHFEKSKFMTKEGIYMAIDAVPVLTETGGGTLMALLECVTTQTTEQLAGTWCGDLLQIVDTLPANCEIIPCCFGNLSHMVMYCHVWFGANQDQYVLNDATGSLFSGSFLSLSGKRGELNYFRVEENKETINYIPVSVSEYEIGSEKLKDCE